MKKNLYLNYIFEFLLNLKLTTLLWPTFLIMKGFTLIDVGICESIFHITSMLGAVSYTHLDVYKRQMTGESAPINLLTYTPVRGLDDVKEASLDMNGITVNIAVIFGTKNASQFIEKMKTADKKYHFVEVMTCLLYTSRCV